MKPLRHRHSNDNSLLQVVAPKAEHRIAAVQEPPRSLLARLRTHRLRRMLSPFVGIAFLGLALWMMYATLRENNLHDIGNALRSMPPSALVQGVLLTVLSYLVLTLYDQLGFRIIGRRMPWRKLALASFAGNVFGNSGTNATLTGAAVRFWIYSSLGVPAMDVTRVVVFCNLGFWLGYFALGAVMFCTHPLALPALLPPPFTDTRAIGIALACLLAGYLLLVATRRPLRFWRWNLALPSPGLTVAQIVVAVCDLLVMSSALWVLLPASPLLSFAHFVQIFLLALVIGGVSQVPGGLGVFETMFLLLLPQGVASPQVFVALLAFRAIYYFAPLIVASSIVLRRAATAHVVPLLRLPALLRRFTGTAIPQLVALAVFAAGAMLLASGALPVAYGRLAWLARIEPLAIIETSHFLASLTGVALLLLARGLQRRLDAAYFLAIVLLTAGIVLSLAKGFDYEEALVLGVLLAALLPCRSWFYRHASLLAADQGWGWAVSIAVVLAGSLWLHSFAFQHFEYSNELWWRFALDAQAPRALRATVGAIVLAMLFAGSRLLRPARPRIALANGADVARAMPVLAESPWTYANLALRRDKALLFSASGRAFLMYGCRGRSWIVMGDPIGPRQEVAELIREFRALCERHGGWPVFFEVRPDNLDLYLEAGLALLKIGEEARVDLRRFDLGAPAHAKLRQARSGLLRHGCSFEIVAREQVPSLLPQLSQVSQAWLASKATREKGFSNASFDATYLRRFPVAVVRRGADILAFANLWTGADREELSVDLMRHVGDAPHGTMDFLFTELMQWGRAQGYRWFNFGMAPLAGLSQQTNGALWRRFGGLVYQYGEHFYNFQGLRAYKDKFGPVWTPRYLASPGGMALPAALLDVTTLVAGGFSGILAR